MSWGRFNTLVEHHLFLLTTNSLTHSLTHTRGSYSRDILVHCYFLFVKGIPAAMVAVSLSIAAGIGGIQSFVSDKQ